MLADPENHPETSPDDLPDSDPDGPSGVRARFERVVRVVQKPKPQYAAALKPIKIDDRQSRLHLIKLCVDLGMAAEQIAAFLPTWGLPVARSTIYDYLSDMKLPRGYNRAEGSQSHHDYFIFRFFIRIAQDAHLLGFVTRKLLKGRLPWEGFRFRPDFKFEVLHYLFFIEMQLSDLTETLWWVKFSHYFRLWKAGHRFRVLFIIDQKKDMAYVRRGRGEFLKRKGERLNLFLFVCLDELKGSGNVAADPVWWTPWGARVAMLEWLPQPGQKPSAPCQ